MSDICMAEKKNDKSKPECCSDTPTTAINIQSQNKSIQKM